MFDYEGSRIEFLKILAEMGEEPAFIGRARAAEVALDALLGRCHSQRAELLEWPRRLFTVLLHRTAGDWSRIALHVAADDCHSLFNALSAKLTPVEWVTPTLFMTDRAVLRQFLESAKRFNVAWRNFLDTAGLADVNMRRDEYNRFYPLEKACAFGNDGQDEGFAPLPMLDRDYLESRFPLLPVPELR